MAAILVQIDGYDPVAAATVALTASSEDDERVCHLDGKTWWPAIMAAPSLRYDLFDGGFGGWLDTPSSRLSLAVEPWADFARYILADARIRIWTGEAGDAWASYTLRFDGRVLTQPPVADGLAEVTIAVDDRWLDTPLLATYAGTGGAEGEAAQKGLPKPLAIGAPRYVPGAMIDSLNSIIQISAYGPLEEVEVPMERLARSFGASSGDHASYAALAAATVPAGSWATAKAVGMVRHGAPPAGRLSYHVKGDKGGPDGWVRLPGVVIKRLALLAGGTGKIDDASLSALNTSRPWPLSFYQGAQITARDLIQRIAASVNAIAGVSWLGKLFVLPVGIGTATLTLDATGATLPPVASVKPLQIDAPWWRLSIEAVKTWEVHPTGDVAFTAILVERGDYVATETYREGHITQHLGSSWLYINPTPSSGNAPPSSGTSNSWWTTFAGKGANAKFAQPIPQLPQFPADSTGAVAAGTAIRIDLINQNLTAADLAGLTWSATAFDKDGVNLGAVTLRTAYAGMIAATNQTTVYLQIGQVPSATLMAAVLVTVNVAGLSPAPQTTVGKSRNGADGAGVDAIFRRSAAQPATPAPSFGVPAGWYTDASSVPASADPLWTSFGQRPNATSNYTWDAPIRPEGTTGAAGLSVAEVTCYQRATSAPATPSGGSYDFATKVLTPPSGWSAVAPSGADPLYAAKGTAAVQGTTGTATPSYIGVGKIAENGPSITIIPDKAGFTYVNGALSPSSQTATFTAALYNLAGTVNWTTTPNIKTGTGTTFTLSTAELGTNAQVVVTATVGTVSQSKEFAKIADPAADITANSQLVVSIQQQVDVAADYSTGAVSGGAKVLTPTVTIGGVDKRTDGSLSYAIQNVSANLAPGGSPAVTVNNTAGSADKGKVTIGTSLTGSGTFQFVPTAGGIGQPPITITVTRVVGAAPSGGGSGGSGTKGGSANLTGQSVSSTAYVEKFKITNLTKASGDTIRCYFSSDYEIAGGSTSNLTRAALPKWQYSVAGANTWSDMAAAVTGSNASWIGADVSAGPPGSVICNQTAAPADGTYDVRLVLAMSAKTAAETIVLNTGPASIAIGV